MITHADGFFARAAVEGLGAAVEALYPANDYGVPDFRETEMVTRTLQYWEELPIRQRRQLMALFALVELAATVLIFGFRRFSTLPVARRERAIRDFRRSSLLPLRIIGDAVKASTTMIYMSHPAVLRHIGMISPCERPADPLLVAVDTKVLARMDAVS